jgi:hypothetical protein
MGKKLSYLFLLLFTLGGFQPLIAQTENAIRTGQNAEAQPATIQYLYEDALAEIKAMLEGKQASSPVWGLSVIDYNWSYASR